MGRHVSDSYTMCWEIHYVNPQFGRMLFVDTLCQVVAQQFAAAKIQQTNIENAGKVRDAPITGEADDKPVSPPLWSLCVLSPYNQHITMLTSSSGMPFCVINIIMQLKNNT